MRTNNKPKVAFFDFTCCEGCQLTVVDSLQTYPELLQVVEIVEFREAMSETSDAYDVAFIEGSCTRESDEARLQDIRERAELVIALGSCANMTKRADVSNYEAIANEKPTFVILCGDNCYYYRDDLQNTNGAYPGDWRSAAKMLRRQLEARNHPQFNSIGQ